MEQRQRSSEEGERAAQRQGVNAQRPDTKHADYNIKSRLSSGTKQRGFRVMSREKRQLKQAH